jgi:hypothetical protein
MSKEKRNSTTDAKEERKGKIEIANSSPLFLDEIKSIPMYLQPKLLHNFMKYIILSLVFFLFLPLLYCQQKDYVKQVIEEHFSKIEIPVLSKSEMYADFDTLSYLFKNVYHAYYIKSQLCNTNYDKKLVELRSQIANVQQIGDFIWILQKAINMFCDGHLYLADLQALSRYHSLESMYDIKFSPENIVRTYKYNLLIRDSLHIKANLGMKFKYLDGQYYTMRAFKYNGQIYPEGTLLKSIDGAPVDTFVNYFYTGMSGALYDYRHKKYYSEYFMVSPDFINEKTCLLVFEDDKKNILQDTFHTDVLLLEGLSKKQPKQIDNPAVFTIYDSILYVRMPNMLGNDDFYIQEIQKLYNEKHIKKIIIDVRGNEGGSDMVWMNVLSHIISDTIRQNVAIYAYNKDKRISDYLERRNRVRNRTDSIQMEYLPMLNSELIKIYKEQEEIFPHENSIRFNGKIVIMQDEYTFSAGGSFVTIAKGKDKIISVGQSIRDIGGRGLAPMIFQLPHTNMLIIMPFVIDYSEVNQMSDFLKIFPEEECRKSLSTVLRSYYSTNPYQLELLLQDECFLKAISL